MAAMASSEYRSHAAPASLQPRRHAANFARPLRSKPYSSFLNLRSTASRRPARCAGIFLSATGRIPP